MTRAVLIGGTGFIGRSLGRALRARGVEALSLSRKKPAGFDGEWAAAYVDDPASVVAHLQSGDLVAYLVHAGIPADTGDDYDREEQANVLPYARLLEAAALARPRLWLYCSSGGQVYGEQARMPIPETARPAPVTAYGRAKLAMEGLTRVTAETHDFGWLVVRPGNPYGPLQEQTNRHGAVPALLRAARDGTPFTAYGFSATVRDYIYIVDAADAIAGLMLGERNRVFNVGSGRGTTLAELARLAGEIVGNEVKLVFKPLRTFDVRQNVLDISAISDSGWEPSVSLAEGLRFTWDYLRSHETP